YTVSHVFFFFQAEDGIRDYKVTGVQTCALPIYGLDHQGAAEGARPRGERRHLRALRLHPPATVRPRPLRERRLVRRARRAARARSEERRVGKECRSRWSVWY